MCTICPLLKKETNCKIRRNDLKIYAINIKKLIFVASDKKLFINKLAKTNKQDLNSKNSDVWIRKLMSE